MHDFKFVHVTGLNLNLGGISHTWIMKIKTKLKSKGACLFEMFWGRPKAYMKPCQTSKMEGFAKIVNGWKSLIIFAKRSILDA